MRKAKPHPLQQARVWELVTPRGDDSRPFVRARCDTKGCAWTDNVSCKVNTPPHVVANKLRSRGWKIKGEGKAATCPQCQRTPSRPQLVIVEPELKPYERPVTQRALTPENASELAGEMEASAQARRDAEAAEQPFEELNRRIQDLLTDALIRPGWTQARLARESGISPATVSRLCAGQSLKLRPTLERTIKQLRTVLGSKPEISAKPMPKPKPESKPSPASRKGLRVLFSLLEEHFDEERGGYAEGHNDATLAADCGLAEEYVAQMREESFGPLRDSPVDALEKRLRETQAKLVATRDEMSELVKKELQAINDELASIRVAIALLKNKRGGAR